MPQNLSSIRIYIRFRSYSGWRHQIIWIYSRISASSIQPFVAVDYHNPGEGLAFREGLRFSMMQGDSFFPSAVHASMSVTCVLLPVVQSSTCLPPFSFTVYKGGISRYTGIWSAFPICPSRNVFKRRRLIRGCWNIIS